MRNFFAPLRTQIDLEENKENSTAGMDGEQQQATSSQAGRPAPIILTSATNLLQKKLGGIARQLLVPKHQKRNQSCHQRTIRLLSHQMFFQSEKLSFYTVFPRLCL
jgi:hypothetical protein